MPLGVWFWLVMAIWLIFGCWREFEPARPLAARGFGVMTFILFAIIGLKIFGSPLT